MTPASSRLRSFVVTIVAVMGVSLDAEARDAAFWKSIVEADFAVPQNESAGALALEVADLAASTDATMRDAYGYEILGAWIYRDHRFSGDELESLRKKLLPAMTSHIGESGNDTIFRRSFSALYMSILAAEDLKRPFLSAGAFQELLDAALRCCAEEKDLRGYVSGKGWAHATAHVADLLKFLCRNEKLSIEQQKQIVAAVARRSSSAGIVFAWGEDARLAAALLSVINRKDFDATGFTAWFDALLVENKRLWKEPAIDAKAYASVRTQGNVLAHLASKIGAQKDVRTNQGLRDALDATLRQVD